LAERESAVGRSASADGKVYLAVEAFARSDGKRLWEYKTAATGERPDVHEKHNLATPTPVSDGKHIFQIGVRSWDHVDRNQFADPPGCRSSGICRCLYSGHIAANDGRHYDVSADGRRFLLLKDVTAPGPAPRAPEMHLIQHWDQVFRGIK
jgi:hypothetical protein